MSGEGGEGVFLEFDHIVDGKSYQVFTEFESLVSTCDFY